MAAMFALLQTWDMPGAIVCMLIAGLAGNIVSVVLFTAAQLAIPPHRMGRVISLRLFGSFGVYPFSVAVGGVLSERLAPVIFSPFSGLLLTLALLVGITQRGFASYRRC
jgi:hypothetical protein